MREIQKNRGKVCNIAKKCLAYYEIPCVKLYRPKQKIDRTVSEWMKNKRLFEKHRSLELNNYFWSRMSKGSRKKIGVFLVARPLRGGGGRAWPLRKNTVFEILKKDRFFCGFPYQLFFAESN